MELHIQTIDKNAAGTVSVSEAGFNREFNEALVHQVVNACLSGLRQGTHAQKNRSDVSGGGAKPWAQKGTGRARAGSSRSPLWRKGGVTFAARPADYSQKVNRKMYRGAMQCILSELIRQERLIVLDHFSMPQPKTRELVGKLKTLQIEHALIVDSNVDENLYLSARNIKNIAVSDVQGIDPVVLLKYNHVIMTVAALKQLEELLG